MAFSAKRVASAFRDGADHAAKRAAVFGGNPARLDLDFLQVFEHGVLARLAVDQRVGRDPVDGERVLRAARPIDLEPAFDFTRVHRRGRQRDRLERSALREAIELFGADVVGDERAPVVHERRDISRDLHGLRQPAHAHLRVDLKGPAEDDAHVGAFDARKSRQLERDAIPPRVEVGRRVQPIPVSDEGADFTGCKIGHCNRNAGDGCTLFVRDIPLQCAEALLRADEAGRGQRERDHERRDA